jgi:hypothetical protein
VSDEPGYVTAADGHTYHKSSSANATTAPTNEFTKENADKTKGLSRDQADFVTVIDYEWQLANTDLEKIKSDYGYTETEWDTLTNNVEVLKALGERGINVKAIAPESDIAKESGRSKLSPLQLIVANSMLNLADTRPVKKKLADAGVSPYMYDSWLKDVEFKAYLQQRAEGLLGDASHEVMLSLVDSAVGGNIKAIEYYHEITGRYVRQNASNQGTSSTHDLQNTVIRIIEIIVEEVDDPQVAARIAERLKGLVMGQQVAGVLPVGEQVIEKPEIMPAREMTDEVRTLMARGVGVNE